MAYNAANLSVLAYANGFTLWHYTTTDQSADAEAAGYFNNAADLLRVGDLIFTNVDTAGTTGAGLFLVKSIVSGAVTLSHMTPVGNT
jgi:hypothetical protein